MPAPPTAGQPVAREGYVVLEFLLSASLISSFVLAGPLGAQSPAANAGVVTGIVQSVDGAPLPFASIALRQATDTALVAARTTDSTGAFRIGGVAFGVYRVDVRRLGYRMATRDGVTVAASAERVDLGVIQLSPIATTLDSVAVTAAPPPITVLPDRNVYAVGDMPATAGGAATDVLRTIPGLEVSPEGAVTTRGATPQIYINGRPAPMQGEALERYLQQLPAERIGRVEVISNPSARYEADGQGGIVNIVLKRGTTLGLGGSVALNAGTRSQRGGSGSLTYQRGRFSLFGSASASFFGTRSENADLRQNLAAQPTTYIQQDSHNRNSGGSGNASLAAELQAGRHETFWVDVGAGRNTSDSRALAVYTYLNDLRMPTQRYDRVNDTGLHGTFGSFAAGYRHAATGGGSEWSIEARDNVNDYGNTSESVRQLLSVGRGAAFDAAPELRFAGQGQNQGGFSLDASFARALGESGRVEAGYRGSERTNGDDFQMSVDEWGDPDAVDQSVGDFRQRERIHAAFVNGTQQIGRFQLQAGLRGEMAEIRRSLPLSSDVFASDYRTLFPSAIITTGFGAGGQVSLSYAKRVDRPWGALLNPATPFLDPLNRRVGNPYLMPRYTHSLGLTVTRTGRLGMLQLSPFYRQTVNSWDQVRTVDTAGVSTVTWENLATISSYGGNLSASLPPLGRVGGFVNVGVYREVRDASNLEADFSGSSTQFSVVGTANVRATSALNLQGTLTYLPARTLPQGRISPMVFSTVGARYKLWGQRGGITLSVTDPFELQHFTFTTRDRTHVQLGSSTFSARSLTLGVSYSFGRQPQRGARRRPDEGQENQAPSIR